MVFGILGAFAIEDWNARRDDRALERAYLGELANDLRADDAELDVNRRAALQRAGAAGRVLEAAGFPPDPLRTPVFSVALDLSDTLMAPECAGLTECLTNYRMFDGSRAAYNELVSSGNLRVLRSRTLIRVLAAYYATMLSETNADMSIGRPGTMALAAALNRHGFPMSHAVPTERPKEHDLIEPIRSDVELRALLLQVRYGAMWQVGRVETFARIPLNEVLAEVEAELERTTR